MTGTLWVTGVCGFSGQHVVDHIRALPNRPRIIGVDRQQAAPPVTVDAYHQCDLCDVSRIASVARVAPPDWVIHLAGLTHSADEPELIRVNAGAARALGRGLALAGCHRVRVVGAGSAAEYDPGAPLPWTETTPTIPRTPYGKSKLRQTDETLAYAGLGIHACVARPFNLVGPGLPDHLVLGRLVSEFSRLAGDGSIVLRTLRTSRDFVDVRDAADAYWRLARSGRAGETYNICSGVTTTIATLVELLSDLTGKQPAICATDTTRNGLDPDAVCGSFDKLQQETGWAPRIALRTSVADMLAHALPRGGIASTASAASH